MRSFYVWSLSCLVGLFLFFAHDTVGQGTRELFDSNWNTTQQRTTRPPPTQVVPPVQMPPTRVPTALQNELPDGETTSPGFSGSVSVPPVNVPMSDELRQRLERSQLNSAGLYKTYTDATTNAEETKQILSMFTSIVDAETEDDREERELSAQRQQAEQIVVPTRRDAMLESVIQMEKARQNRLTRRAVDEAGADLFYHPRLKEQQFLSADWCQLFDGHTDFGWKVQDSGHYAGGKFTFGQGEICSDPFHPGMVYTNMPFGDVSLRFDYWVEKGSEVLLLLNTPPNPADLNSSCYTIVLESEKISRPRGLLLGRHGYSLPDLRAMRDRQVNSDTEEAEEDGTWHSARVRIDEGTIQVEIDKQGVSSYFDQEPISAGHIAFLVAKGKARFCNIIWQPAQTVAVFDSENEKESSWRRSDGVGIIGNNTAGFRLSGGTVESREVFGNFVLQMQYYQGNISGDSSLFVRAVPKQDNSGYEISLQNFPTRQDRESVVGVDAGSFRQRRDARYVRAQDMQWNYLTVAVMNRQLATWVNGVPVCEIEDKRITPFPPGTGPFLAPGTIRLAVPDDNTFFQLRRLMVSPIP